MSKIVCFFFKGNGLKKLLEKFGGEKPDCDPPPPWNTSWVWLEQNKCILLLGGCAWCSGNGSWWAWKGWEGVKALMWCSALPQLSAFKVKIPVKSERPRSALKSRKPCLSLQTFLSQCNRVGKWQAVMGNEGGLGAKKRVQDPWWSTVWVTPKEREGLPSREQSLRDTDI